MLTSKCLDYQQLYNFIDPLATLPFRMHVRSESAMLSADQHWLLTHGKIMPDTPHIYDAGRGGKATDILWAYNVSIFFFSPRLLQLLHDHDITGWNSYAVELYDRKGNLLSGYKGIAVVGPECTRDRSRSQIIDKPAPVEGGRGFQVYQGLFFDESEWDGSDMFWVSEGGGIVVTDKVRELFRRYGIRNVELTPLPQVEIRVSNDQYGSTARAQTD